MTDEKNDKISNLCYFLAGTLLPTLAYAFLLRQKKRKRNSNTSSSDSEEDDDSSGDEFEPILMRVGDKDHPKSWGMADAPYKMVLCVNMSLKMGKGKVAAQCCHATMGTYKRAKKQCPAALRAWELSGCAKIAVKCPTEEEMTDEIWKKAAQKGIPYYIVEDAGRTQIAAGSRTVLALGPAPVRLFDGVTSHLKLM